MKVVHLINTLSAGGAELHLLTLCRHMKQQGVDVALGFLLAAVAIFSLFPVKSTLPHSEFRFSGSSSASKNSFLG